MARVATFLLAATITPLLDVGLYNVRRDAAFPAAGGPANGDYCPLFAVARAGRIIDADIAQSATLGAGCTVKLSLYRAGALVRDLTVATAGGAAGYANANTLGPIDVQAGDEVVVVVGGANVAAAATVTADVQLQH
jgi:hypothetical protein